QQATATGGDFSGVTVSTAVVQSTGAGLVTVHGRGGSSGSTAYGVCVTGGGLISGGGGGAPVYGEGGGGAGGGGARGWSWWCLGQLVDHVAHRCCACNRPGWWCAGLRREQRRRHRFRFAHRRRRRRRHDHSGHWRRGHRRRQ